MKEDRRKSRRGKEKERMEREKEEEYNMKGIVAEEPNERRKIMKIMKRELRRRVKVRGK